MEFLATSCTITRVDDQVRNQVTLPLLVRRKFVFDAVIFAVSKLFSNV